MKKLLRISLAFAGLIMATCAYSQKASLKGVLSDTSAKEKLVNTSVSLLRAKDSVLYKFTRAGMDGSFAINNIDTGRYIMLITRNRYADYYDVFNFAPGETKDAGSIPMILKATLLQDVVIRQKIAAMRMRGDTLEFTADSFHVREGASVEDMLKILPGIQVDKNGNITAQGEKVEKVLVDGEEFFGNDPTVATQNLQADAIDKVQVFDKKSDQAEFTGIDDGEKKKTINLTLKADKKKGYFGKLDLGGGTDERWSNSGMINNFKGKEKVSAFGIMSSTGKTGLSWEENNQYGGSTGPEFNDDFGGFFFFSGNDDEFGNESYYGEGIPKSWAGGLNYSNKFNDDKQSLNGSYRYNKISSTGSGNTFSQSILPDSLFFNRDNGFTFNSRQRHSLNGTYEWNIDSSTSVKIKANGYVGKNNIVSNFNSGAFDANNIPVNESIRNTVSDGDNNNLNANFTLRKKFKKPGRTISFNLSEVMNNNNSTGFLYALNSFYGKGILIGQDTTDQKKLNDTRVATFNSKVVYTEPVVKNLFVEFNYAYRNNRSNAEKLSYDRGKEGDFDLLNDTFSSHYVFNVDANSGGAAFKYNGKKITASLGSDISAVNFNQQDLFNDTVFKRSYTNFFPRAGFMYKFNQTSRININYSGSTNQPSIQQIQPIADNSNPLSITIGNPDLKQEFRHSVNFNFNSFKVFSQRGFWGYGNFTFTQNAIVSNQNTDETGKTIYQYTNTNGNYNGYAGLGYFKKLTKLNANMNAGFNINANRYSSFINNEKNITNNNSFGINAGFSKEKEKKYNINYYANVDYNISRSSINPELKTNYITQSHNLGLTVYLPWKLEVNNDLNANLRQKTSLFDANNNVFLWNAYIGKKILKKDKGLIKLSVYDLLNQNRGYDRYISTSQIQEKNYQTLTRYFMLSFVWNFSKNAAGDAAEGVIIRK